MGPKSRSKRKRPAVKAPDAEKIITAPLSEQSMKEHNESLPPKGLSEFVMLDCSTSSEDLTIADAKIDDSPDFVRRTRRKSATIAAEAELLCSTSSEPSSSHGEDVTMKTTLEVSEDSKETDPQSSLEDKYREMLKRIKVIPVKATEHRFGLGGKTSCFVMELFTDSDIMATSASEPSIGALEETASEFMDTLPAECQSDMDLTDSLLFSPNTLEASPTCTGESAHRQERPHVVETSPTCSAETVSRQERSIDFVISAFPPISVVSTSDESEKEGPSWEGLLKVHLQWHPMNKIRSALSSDQIPKEKTLTHAVKLYLSQLSLLLKELDNAIPINAHDLIGELLAVGIRPTLSAKTKQLPPQQMFFDRLWASYENGHIDNMTELGCHMVEIAEEMDAWIQIVHRMTVRTDFGLPWWVEEEEEDGVQISVKEPSALSPKPYDEVVRLVKSKVEIVRSVRALQLSPTSEARRTSRFSESKRAKHIEDCKSLMTGGADCRTPCENDFLPTAYESSTNTVLDDGKDESDVVESTCTQRSESPPTQLDLISPTEAAVASIVHDEITNNIPSTVVQNAPFEDSNASSEEDSFSKTVPSSSHQEFSANVGNQLENCKEEEETSDSGKDENGTHSIKKDGKNDDGEDSMCFTSCTRVNSEMHLLAEVVASDEDAEVPDNELSSEAAVANGKAATIPAVDAIECMIQEMTTSGSEMMVDE